MLAANEMENIKKDPKFERTTQEQLLFYIEFCRQHPELLAGKNTARSPMVIQNLWAEIAANLNAMRGPTRTPAKWKENLGVWKSQLRARARKKKSDQQLTGGGPSSSRMLTDFEERALSTFGAAAVDGVPGIVTLGIETSPPIAMVEEAVSPATIRVGSASPGTTNFMSSSPLSPSMLPCSPASDNISENSAAATSVRTIWPSAANLGSSSPSTVSLGPSSPRAISQQDIYAVVMRSIEQRDARDERMLQLQLATLEAIEKLATAIRELAARPGND